MQLRRLIAAPLIAFVATAVAAAVVDTGQRTRAEAVQAPRPVSGQPTAVAEQLRVEDALRAEESCVGAIDCDPARAAGRVRIASELVARWPADPAYRESRRLLVARMQARAALLDQDTLTSAGGRPEPAVAEHAELLRTQWLRAARDELQARRDAGLITRSEQARQLGALLHSE